MKYEDLIIGLIWALKGFLSPTQLVLLTAASDPLFPSADPSFSPFLLSALLPSAASVTHSCFCRPSLLPAAAALFLSPPPFTSLPLHLSAPSLCLGPFISSSSLIRLCPLLIYAFCLFVPLLFIPPAPPHSRLWALLSFFVLQSASLHPPHPPLPRAFVPRKKIGVI